MDIGASVLAKLKNKSQASGISFQVHLRLFCQEEFLRRLSLSNYGAVNLIAILSKDYFGRKQAGVK